MPDFPSAHFDDILAFTMSPYELLARGSLMFWFLFLIFRFILRRDTGSVGISDFLFVVILGDASQNAMIGEGTSVADGMLLIATLVFWNWLLDFLSYRFPAIDRFTSPTKLCLVRDGKMLRRQMRKEYITAEDIQAKLRESGIDDIGQVKAMYMEGDGEISVLKR
jgi:uncharacterized membrane protein YcaP (DUF421 family)